MTERNDTATFERWESTIRGYCRWYPTVFETASNARQVDELGRSYIDFFAGAGVLNFGHNNARMKRALIDFIETDGVAHSLDMYTSAKRAFIDRFAKVILEPREMEYRLQFTGPTGTNVVEAALKLARKVTGRRTVVAFSHGFHGMTLGSLACTANAYFRDAAGVPLDNVVRLPFEGAPGGGIESLEDFAATVEDASSGVSAPAAFIVETIQAEGGVNVASQEWLSALERVARRLGALFIIDDIQVGVGRTGTFFSFDGMELDPDIVCLAKGVGGFGTPLAFNLIKPEHDVWQPGEHTGTFRGQGLSFVAGREALGYFKDDDLMGAVADHGALIEERLHAIAQRYDGVEVRGRGMIHGLDIGDGERSKEIAKASFEHGLLVGPCGPQGRVIKTIPPLTTPRADLEEGLDILDKAVTRIMEKG